MLDEWSAEVCAALGLEPEVSDTKAILDLARDAAHQVARPAAPLTAFLVGVAVGRGRTLDDAIATVNRLLAQRPAPAE